MRFAESPHVPSIAEQISLRERLLQVSPRFNPPRTPARALLIHGAVMALWVALFARAFTVNNVYAWSAGLVYVLYDSALLAFVFWQTLALRHPAALAVSSTPCTLSVIVAAHNEADVLAATIDALMAQSSVPNEIIIADDGSTDATDQVFATRFGLAAPALGEISPPSPAVPQLRWLRLPHGGKAVALNAALILARSDVVMTVDADTLLDHGAVAAMRQAFAADAHLVAATGILTPVCADTPSGRVLQWFQTYEYIRNFLSRFAWGRLDSLLLISGAFGAYRRAAVLEVGGFDDDCLVEDYELIHRLRRHAVQIGQHWTTTVVGSARAATDAPGNVAAFLNQRRRWFGGFLQTQYWYRDMIGQQRYGWLGVAMLPVKAIDTFQPIYGLLGAGLLIAYLAGGHLGVLAPVAGVIGAKIVLDIGFHLWGVVLYRRWAGGQHDTSLPMALLSSLIEPFSFQILRHLGASLGWVMLLTGVRSWGQSKRGGLLRTISASR